jgi:diguanylate cyclase (GGDEF)-like protein/PAS domain S-box-containing protein
MQRHSRALTGNLWALAALWMLVLALSLLGWSLLSSPGGARQAQRAAKTGGIVSAELAPALQRGDVSGLALQTRALLVRQDIGFAWLRVRDSRGRVVAAAGRLESGLAAGLPGGLRRQLYTLISTEHRVALVHDGREIGTLEFGLLPGDGSGGRLLLGLLMLGISLPALLLLSLRLKSAFQADWSAGGTAAARAAAVSVLEPGTAAPSVLPRQATAIPAGADELLKVFDRGAIAVDRNQTVLHLNPLAAELTGWESEQAHGRPLSEVLKLHQADLRRPVVLSLEGCFGGASERVQGRYYLRARDGALHEVDLDAGPVRDALGDVTGVLLSLSAVARGSGMLQQLVPAQALASQQERQQLSQMLLDQVLECVVTTDSQDRIQFANGRALESFGYTLPELRGEHVSRLLPVPFLRQAQLRVADLALSLPGMPAAQVIARRRDSSQFAATLVVHPVSFRGRQGHVITIRPVRAPAEGDRLGPRLRHLLESSPGEVYVADPDSLQLITANPRALENLGFSMEQLAQMTLLRLCPRLPPEILRSHVTRLREGAADIAEYRSWHQRANGTGYEAQSRLSLWSGEGAPVLLVVAQEVTGGAAARPEAALREDRIEFLAHHDALTGLPSRPLFMQRLEKAIATSTDPRQSFAVIHLALAGFGEVNQEYGYETGDRLLKAVADRLSETVRGTDSVARLGGDEFILLMGGLRRREDAIDLLKRLQQSLSRPLRAGAHEIGVKAYLGATVYPDDADTPDLLLRHAGLALREARAKRPGEARLYSPGVATAAPGVSDPAGLLSEAQARGELAVELQPLGDARARLVIGAEVLLAWRYPAHGLLRTAEQLRQAGGNPALAAALGSWVLEQACEQQANWRNLELHALPLLVNLSALPLANRRAAQSLRGVLARLRVPPEQLIVMINAAELESMLLDTDSWLPVLRDLGLRLGINDVDPGRMDLLRHADVDVVRLTPRTIAGLPGSRDAADQTATIIQAAQRLGARVFASGVERAEQREALLALGCHVQQGRLQGEPLPPQEFARMLVRSEAGVF